MTERSDFTTFTTGHPDFAAIFCAVGVILDCQKPNRRAKMVEEIKAVAASISTAKVTATPAMLRAGACLFEAVERWEAKTKYSNACNEIDLPLIYP
jgi:hypothetical protein